MASILLSIVALFVSIVALVYTAETFWLKAGAQIRGGLSTISSVSSEDKYVGTVILENLKDRAIAIYKIYLRLGYNVYIEIEDFETDPLILKPFEVFRKDYDPVDMHSLGMSRVKVNQLFDDKTLKRRLVLSTSEGRLIIREGIDYWDPVADYFKNYSTAIIRPLRSTYKGKAYGSNAKFIVEVTSDGGSEQIIPIYPEDYRIRKFKNFSLTEKSLGSRESLADYLQKKISDGSLQPLEIAVHDLESWRKDIYEDKYERKIQIGGLGWFHYYIVARIGTILEDLRRKWHRRNE